MLNIKCICGYFCLSNRNYLPCLLPIACCLLTFGFVYSQSPTRLAVIDFVGDESREFSVSLRELVKTASSEFVLLDDDLVRAAAHGAGYAGNLNLDREEARALGQSIGCDFYILGKILIARRTAEGNQFYFEALAGLFFVETRTGKLIRFSFESVKAQTEQEAKSLLKETLQHKWGNYSKAISSARSSHIMAIDGAVRPTPTGTEFITEGIAVQVNSQPFFYQRLKPVYTEQAELAGITATVELEAVFRDDGTVGEVEVVRWAGFGLDESSIETVRKLRFKPAEHDGKRLTIKGLVRYNFRRPLTQAERQEEIERLKRSLLDIKKVPTQIPGHRPKL